MSIQKQPLATILLVDDDKHLLESMGSWLASCGFDVDLAEGSSQACAALQIRRYDLCIVDLRLEDGDGFDVLEYSRKNHPETSVILMTGYGTVETGIEALRAVPSICSPNR